VIVLEFREDRFVEASGTPSGIRVELDKATKQVKVFIPAGTSLVKRRTALRQAESIARTGFLRDTGERVGIGWELVVNEEDTGIPERLTKHPLVSYATAPAQTAAAPAAPAKEASPAEATEAKEATETPPKRRRRKQTK